MLVGLVIIFLAFKMALPFLRAAVKVTALILWAAVKVIMLRDKKYAVVFICYYIPFVNFLILSSAWWPISYDYRLWVN